MTSYDIKYEILNYEKFYKRINDILTNPNNKYIVEKLEPIGKTKCGFDIEHFKIGNGTTHIVYMGGCHGNEIIGVDYITQLMNNIAQGLGEYENFDPNEFTIDFIPCQNPEGFFTTTYALDYFMKNMNETEIEEFSKKYYLYYKQDDINVLTINKILLAFYKKVEPIFDVKFLQNNFWNLFRNKEINIENIIEFLIEFKENLTLQEIQELVKNIWQEKLDLNYTIPKDKYHHVIFNLVTLECIPEIDEKHQKLKAALTDLYKQNNFPMGTLANFFANASGVNLNDNNEYYYQELNNRISNEGDVYANLRDNNLIKNINGPLGMPNIDMNKPFEYSEENIALLNFLEEQKENNYAFFNCHGTGGMLFLYPVVEDDLQKAHHSETTRRFQFYINNRIATEYTKQTGKIYEQETGKNTPYISQGHPDKITGVGDVLRTKYLASFLLELSKAGGNPIAPYCDKNGNFRLTMISNFSASAKILETILELKHLYGMTYTIEYNENNVVYKTK